MKAAFLQSAGVRAGIGFAVIAFGGLLSHARAELLTHRDLPYAVALTIAQTAVESCMAKGYPESAVVVDRDGETIGVHPWRRRWATHCGECAPKGIHCAELPYFDDRVRQALRRQQSCRASAGDTPECHCYSGRLAHQGGRRGCRRGWRLRVAGCGMNVRPGRPGQGRRSAPIGGARGPILSDCLSMLGVHVRYRRTATSITDCRCRVGRPSNWIEPSDPSQPGGFVSRSQISIACRSADHHAVSVST